MFIVLEGLDGCGKSTFAKELKDKLEAEGYKVGHTRDPGGCPYSEKIRDIFLTTEPENPNTDLCLMFASRFEHIASTINSLKAENDIVICERFYYSSWAYQVLGSGATEKLFYSLRQMVDQLINIDLVALLNISDDTVKTRLAEKSADRLENVDFLLDKVKKGFFCDKPYPESSDIFSKEKLKNRFIELPNNTLEEKDLALEKIYEKIIYLFNKMN
jgi:dTMP kinase